MTRRSRDDAVSVCKAMGAELIKIGNVSESDYVVEQIKMHGDFWTSATNDDFLRWRGKKLVDNQKTCKNCCVAVNEHGHWMQLNCSEHLPSICTELDIEPFDELSTVDPPGTLHIGIPANLTDLFKKIVSDHKSGPKKSTKSPTKSDKKVVDIVDHKVNASLDIPLIYKQLHELQFDLHVINSTINEHSGDLTAHGHHHGHQLHHHNSDGDHDDEDHDWLYALNAICLCILIGIIVFMLQMHTRIQRLASQQSISQTMMNFRTLQSNANELEESVAGGDNIHFSQY